VPYNSRIFKAFGSGGLHYCGVGNQQADNFLNTEGPRVINNYSVYHPKELAEMKRKVEGRIVIQACDFTPDNYREYYDELLSEMPSLKGLVIDSQVSPVLALLEGGKYAPQVRDASALRQAVFNDLSERFRR
jgi:hypothetical protein